MKNSAHPRADDDTNQPPLMLSVVVPVFNEEQVLPMFHRRLVNALASVCGKWEVIYIDDGSTDNTFQLLKQFKSESANVGFARFSRNFGKEEAMTAGLRLALGCAVIVIDADLQDPPEFIPVMLDAWSQGADVINMRRRRRHNETWFKKLSAYAFYRVINCLSEVPIPADVGDFRLLSRRAVDALNQLQESNRFMKGLFAWIGYRQMTLDYDRAGRVAGKTKWRYPKLWKFALEGITGFSVVPLKAATYVGFACSVGTLFYGLYFLVKTLFIGEAIKGFPTLIVAVLILGGLQLMAIGIIGEYLGRLFIESKRRPLYFLEEYEPSTVADRLPLQNTANLK